MSIGKKLLRITKTITYSILRAANASPWAYRERCDWLRILSFCRYLSNLDCAKRSASRNCCLHSSRKSSCPRQSARRLDVQNKSNHIFLLLHSVYIYLYFIFYLIQLIVHYIRIEGISVYYYNFIFSKLINASLIFKRCVNTASCGICLFYIILQYCYTLFIKFSNFLIV